MAVAVKKILYAVDAKESALSEAQEYLNESVNAAEPEKETENENDPWTSFNFIMLKGK